MEIFHGGYFDKQLDGTKKYKVPRFNKLGGKIYLDGLDPDMISWVDMNNIAYSLGYRELPISYHFKEPRSSHNEGWIQIKNDGDAVEMVNMIPKKKRQISVYITGGGRRRKHEAFEDFQKPYDPNWENPLNKQTAGKKERAFYEANLMASQLYKVHEVDEGDLADDWEAGVNVGEGSNKVAGSLNMGENSNMVGEGVNVGEGSRGGPSEGTFGGLSDIVKDINLGSQNSLPLSSRDVLQKKIAARERRVRVEAEKKERDDLDKAEREAAELRESQASAGLSIEEAELRRAELVEQRERESAEELAREETEKKEKEAAENRAKAAFAGRQKLANELEERLLQYIKGKNTGRTPKELKYNTRHKGQKKYEVVENDDSDDGSEYYVDSDYDLEHDEFDDLEFDENVSKPRVVPEYEEMGFTGYCSDEAEDSDELQSLDSSGTDEDEDGNPIPRRVTKGGLKIRPWIRSVDLKNPKFRLGLAFPNSEQLKEAVREYAIRNQYGVWFEKNSKTKIEVKCQWECPFRLYASRIKGEGDTLFIKTLNKKHICSPVETSHFLTYRRVAQEIQDTLLVDEDWSRKGIHNHINKKFNLDLGVQTITRAKRAAKHMNEGHYIDQYNKLAAYGKELLRSNPGSTVKIKTQMDGPVRRFHRMYICLAACKEGWIRGCRRLIGLDGYHIKGHHPGQLLTAIGVDANNGMFPIAYAVTEIESQETWTWFLEYLMWDLQMERDSNYAFITDKQKRLGNAIENLFPNAHHRHCVRHLYNNFKLKHPGEGLKQLMWNAARSSTEVWYNKHMDDLRELSDKAWEWFGDKNPAQWSRAFFKDESKCDILLNNLCESFNSAILPARDKPVITMLEKIRMDMMVRQANRRVACERWKDIIGPRIKKIIDKVSQRASKYKAHRSGEYIFQITGDGDMGSKHAVDLGRHICTCKRWQLSGIPCVHAICAIRFKKHEAALYCDDYLMSSTYVLAYNPIIYPIAGEDDWEPVDYPIAPPPYKKQVGRPKKMRHKEPGEKAKGTEPPAPKEGKMPKTGIKMSCKICGQQGHNKLGCPITKAKKAAASAEGTSSGATTKKRQRSQISRAPAPKGNTNVMDQVIRSRKTWKKVKHTVEASFGNNDGASTSQSTQQLPTQSSQNPAARGSKGNTSGPARGASQPT